MKEQKPVTVAQLAENLCVAMENGISPDTPVKITLAEESCGPRAWSLVSSAMLGFDWETGDFRIEPMQPLVKKENTENHQEGKNVQKKN